MKQHDNHHIKHTVDPRIGQTAAQAGLALCLSCHQLNKCAAQEQVKCIRCGAKVTPRKPMSLFLTWLYIGLAILLFIPANILPIMTFLNFGRGEPTTIIGGVILLAQHHLYGIAAVVFIASFLVPLGKVTGLSILLLSIHGRWDLCPVNQTKLFRIIEFFGRWSMLDIYVLALLVGVVQLGKIANIIPGAGAMAFGAVVVITMLAALSFDPRLIWDE